MAYNFPQQMGTSRERRTAQRANERLPRESDVAEFTREIRHLRQLLETQRGPNPEVPDRFATMTREELTEEIEALQEELDHAKRLQPSF